MEPKPSGEPEDKTPALRELVRQAERVVDHQVEIIERQSERNAHAARTAVALLTVMVSGTGLLVHTESVSLPTLILLPTTMLFAAWASIRLVLLSTGFRNPGRSAAGIRPVSLARTPQQRLRPLLEAIQRRMIKNWRHNKRILRKMRERRSRSILILFASFGTFLIGIAYTLTMTMLGWSP